MKNVAKYLEKLRGVERKRHHPLIHKIHKKYGISKKTLLYVKEYGSHSYVLKNIIKESIKILIFASILSSFGGLALEYIKVIFISIVPLVILLPALNDIIGDYGIIISSRFSTLLHKKGINGNLWKSEELKNLFIQIFIISVITVVIASSASLIISKFSGYEVSTIVSYKILLISLIDVILLVGILFLIGISAGLYFYKKNEDPNNFLIPITTSIADFGNMIILTVLIILFF